MKLQLTLGYSKNKNRATKPTTFLKVIFIVTVHVVFLISVPYISTLSGPELLSASAAGIIVHMTCQAYICCVVWLALCVFLWFVLQTQISVADSGGVCELLLGKKKKVT